MLYSINIVTTQCSCVNQKVKISTDNCSYPEVSFCKHSYYGIYSFKKVTRIAIIESACTGAFIGTLHVWCVTIRLLIWGRS